MSLEQLSAMRRWHLLHGHRQPLEGQAWDAVLCLWVMGLVGLPVSIVLGQPLAAMAAGAAIVVPTAYCAMRRHLHRRRRLRCDWLPVLEP
jgi:hypothetical protein